MVERIVVAQNSLAQKKLLSDEMRKAIDKQIQTVAANTQKFFR
jgi:hypothetical protein